MDPKAFHDFEHDGWQVAAAHYTRTFGKLTSQAADPILDAVGATRGTRLVDLATGPGYVAAAAAARGAQVVGIDFSTAMIDDARRAHPQIEFRVGDIEVLADNDGAYDAAVMSFGILHLARPEAAIAEVRRVLVDGGRFAFTAWTPPDRAIGFGIILNAIAKHGRTDVGLPEGPPFFRFADHDECRRCLAAFRDVDVQIVPLVWRLAAPDDLFAAALQGGVRTSALLRAQTPDAIAMIRETTRRDVEQLADLAVPMPIVVASARA